MARSYNILPFLFLILLLACEQTTKKEESHITKTALETKRRDDQIDSFGSAGNKEAVQSDCNFDRFLNDQETPKIAKELYANRYKLNDDEPLSLLEYLNAKDTNKRQFYFRVITNSYTVSDGAYSEGLGNIGKEYVENKTQEFASYFDIKPCFSDEDLETWADIAILEFSIIGEGDYENPIIDDFNRKLEANCKDCSASQKITIGKFGRLLKKKWQDYLKTIDK